MEWQSILNPAIYHLIIGRKHSTYSPGEGSDWLMRIYFRYVHPAGIQQEQIATCVLCDFTLHWTP